MDDARADSSRAQAPKLSPGVPIIVGADGWAVGRFGRRAQADLLRISLKLRALRGCQEGVCAFVLVAGIVLRRPRIAFSSRLQLRDKRFLESSIRQHSAELRRTADEVRVLSALGTCRDSTA